MSFAMEGIVRHQQGKGSARRARAAETVPAIVYGPGREAISITVSPKELSKALLGPKRRNQVIALSIKDTVTNKTHALLALVKDLQADPVKRTPLHVDFIEVKKDKAVVANVPVEAFGKSKASVQGAILQLVTRTIKVSVLPSDIPEKIMFDTTEQGFGVVRAKGIALPKGVTLVDHPETPILSLRMPRGEKEDAPAAGAAAAPADPKAKGAPAADAKAGDKKDDKKK
jgi:large subunit ribosomal protein L25